MPTTNLSFAKVVATPTSTSWSQAYNAGSLFIVLSLQSSDEDVQKDIPTLGKQVLSNIEAEFFVLEDKTFESIKQTLPQTVKDLPKTVTLSLTLAYVKENMLYGYVVSGGRITLKRGDQLGTILHLDPTDSKEIMSASGYLESDDLIFLQTAPFAQTVPAKTITQAFEVPLPNDIAETLSPHIHGGDEGGASAIILSFKGTTVAFSGVALENDSDEEILASTPLSPNKEPDEETKENQDEKELEDEGKSLKDAIEDDSHKKLQNEEEDDLMQPPIEKPLPDSSSLQTERVFSEDRDQKARPSFKDRFPVLSLTNLHLPRQKKLALGLTILLGGLLLLSIVFVLTSRGNNQSKVLFEEIYNAAKKDYDEGEGLLSLNKSLARDDYESAKTHLERGHGKFSETSDEGKKLAELERLVNARLSETEGSVAAIVKEITAEDAPASLRALQEDKTILSSTEDEDGVYTLSKKSITKLSTDLDDEEELIENDSTWSKAVSLGVFSANLYVLDQTEGLLKFVPTANDYALSSYFQGSAPSLSSARGLAIDSSIYILFSDGSIQKYTRGTKDSFSVSGLEKDLSSPKSIFTSPDLDSIYVLDPASSRIVKLDKSGSFQSQYQAEILSKATAFHVSSDEKTAYVLSNGKFYSVGL